MRILTLLALSFMPMAALAATTANDVLEEIARLINLATPIVVALALLYFFWGLASYILKSGDKEGKDEGRKIMIWGIIALFVMVSVWGIVNVVRDTFGLQNNNAIDVPGIDVNGGQGSTR